VDDRGGGDLVGVLRHWPDFGVILDNRHVVQARRRLERWA